MDNERLFQTAALLGGLSVPLFPAVAAVEHLAGNRLLLGLIGFAGLEFLIVSIFISATLLESEGRVIPGTVPKLLVEPPGLILWGLVALTAAQAIQIRLLLWG